jgi:hypothetical protein
MTRAKHNSSEREPGAGEDMELERIDGDLRRSIDRLLGRPTPEPRDADGLAREVAETGGEAFTQAVLDSARAKARDRFLDLFNRGLGEAAVSRQRVECAERAVGRFGRWDLRTLGSGLGVIRLRIEAGRLVNRTALMERDIQLRTRGDRPSSLAIVLRGDAEELVAQGPVPDEDGLIWTFALEDLGSESEYRPVLDCFLAESRVFQQTDAAQAAGVDRFPEQSREERLGEEEEPEAVDTAAPATSGAGEEGPVRCIFPEMEEGAGELTVGFKWGPAAEGKERFETFKKVFFAVCRRVGIDYRNEKFVPIFGQIFITFERREEERVDALLKALNQELGGAS